MKQDPNSGSNGKIFTATVSLPADQNTVPVAAEDLSTIGNPPGPQNGGNLTTRNYSVTVVGGQDKTFKYDSNGNLTNSVAGTTTNDYQWDAENRLVKITQSSPGNPTLVSDFTYDGFSRWAKIVEKSNGTVTSTKQFVWYGKQLAEERDANNTVVKRFFPEGERYGIANYYFTKDHLGNIREMVDSSGTIRARYDYDPYGRRTKVSGDLEADFGFTGYYVHQPSGLQLALYRAYDADTGRWINRDPIGEMGGLNLYDYVGNNPVNLRDAFGLVDCDKLRKKLLYLYRRGVMDSRALSTMCNNQHDQILNQFIGQQAAGIAAGLAVGPEGDIIGEALGKAFGGEAAEVIGGYAGESAAHAADGYLGDKASEEQESKPAEEMTADAIADAEGDYDRTRSHANAAAAEYNSKCKKCPK
jgi:RHS repeat-associated protein